MSITAVRPYIQAQMQELGFSEHTDPFNDENIPSNIIDGAYHQQMLEIIGVEKNNVAQGVEVPVQVKAFFKGYRTPEEALEYSIVRSEEIVTQMLRAENFFNFTPAITGVFLDSLSFEPYDGESNDNIVVAVFTFRFKIWICIQE
jgi:hypothetical protein